MHMTVPISANCPAALLNRLQSPARGPAYSDGHAGSFGGVLHGGPAQLLAAFNILGRSIGAALGMMEVS
jgi:hypothetical protein